MASFTAALFHELCHILAVLLAGGKIEGIKVGLSGAVIEASFLSPWGELFSIIAGPAGSLSLLLLSSVLPKLSICGIVQGLFNLLPVYPLDGGRVVRCMCSLLFSQVKANQVSFYLEIVVLILGVFLGIFCSITTDMGIIPALAALFLLSKTMYGKISCKEGNMGVQ